MLIQESPPATGNALYCVVSLQCLCDMQSQSVNRRAPSLLPYPVLLPSLTFSSVALPFILHADSTVKDHHANI